MTRRNASSAEQSRFGVILLGSRDGSDLADLQFSRSHIKIVLRWEPMVNINLT